jgi:hypothetical protein
MAFEIINRLRANIFVYNPPRERNLLEPLKPNLDPCKEKISEHNREASVTDINDSSAEGG